MQSCRWWWWWWWGAESVSTRGGPQNFFCFDLFFDSACVCVCSFAHWLSFFFFVFHIHVMMMILTQRVDLMNESIRERVKTRRLCALNHIIIVKICRPSKESPKVCDLVTENWLTDDDGCFVTDGASHPLEPPPSLWWSRCSVCLYDLVIIMSHWAYPCLPRWDCINLCFVNCFWSQHSTGRPASFNVGSLNNSTVFCVLHAQSIPSASHQAHIQPTSVRQWMRIIIINCIIIKPVDGAWSMCLSLSCKPCCCFMIMMVFHFLSLTCCCCCLVDHWPS